MAVGSALLFVAMVVVSMALAGGLLARAGADLTEDAERGLTSFARAMMHQISNVYALRMGGVFRVSLATVWRRTGLVTRWPVVSTYLLASAMLVIVNRSLWVTLLFPTWVLVLLIALGFGAGIAMDAAFGALAWGIAWGLLAATILNASFEWRQGAPGGRTALLISAVGAMIVVAILLWS